MDRIQELRQFQVDAFARNVFEGNPAAVVPLDEWLPDAVMQAIAAENNLSETAFFVPVGSVYGLRWFTPLKEVDLCGHATLATAHVLYEHLGASLPSITFRTLSGELRVRKSVGVYSMDFPLRRPTDVQVPTALVSGIGCSPFRVLAADDYIAVLADEEAVRLVVPDHLALMQLDLRGVIVTAPGNHTDFVSRFFAPKFGVPEDPVTGSAHCALVPYWAERLGKGDLNARQVSRRGGNLSCKLLADRVELTGSAVTFMKGTIRIPVP